jgi:hypothetical protein
MMKIKILQIVIFICLVATGMVASAQQNVGINILIPDSTAILHLESTKMGFLPPRMTTIQRDSITTPATGLVIFNTVDSTVQYFNGICWLNVFQQNCNDCFFTLTSSSIADTIDRVVADSIGFTLNVQQNTGTPQNIAFATIGNLPAGMQVIIQPNPILSSGQVDVLIRVTPYIPEGTYPIIIQALCGGQVQNFVYSVYLTPCYQLNVSNNTNNYNLATALYTTYPTIPQNQAVCVVATVDAGVDVTSTNSNLPAFNVGNIPSGSNVAIVNNGNILGRGGNGGIAFDPIQGWNAAGDNGGNAINLTTRATIQNNFNIYGGGGGGNAMAFSLSFSPGFGITFGFLIGAGGGGGAGAGLGGNIPTIIGLTFYNRGQNATSGQFAVPGNGGLLNVPISTTQGPLTISITPFVLGGNGGAYGFPGTQGVFAVALSAFLTVNIPFIGPITIPVIQNLNIPIPIPTPPAGQAGFAVKRNGNQVNIPDNSYNTSFLKGRVGN